MKEQILGQMEKDKQKREQKTQEEKQAWLTNPLVKGTGILVLSVTLLWGSGFLFSAVGFAIKSFKGMLRNIKEG